MQKQPATKDVLRFTETKEDNSGSIHFEFSASQFLREYGRPGIDIDQTAALAADETGESPAHQIAAINWFLAWCEFQRDGLERDIGNGGVVTLPDGSVFDEIRFSGHSTIENLMGLARSLRRRFGWPAGPMLPKDGDLTNPIYTSNCIEAICKWAVGKLRKLERPTDSAAVAVPAAHPVANDPAPQWPPDEGWHFRPGEAAFRGTAFRVVGQCHKLLELLAQKREAVSCAKLQKHLANDREAEIEKDTVRAHVSNLRRSLRSHFHCGQSDPIPYVDRGSQLAWRLDLSLLQPRLKSV